MDNETEKAQRISNKSRSRAEKEGRRNARSARREIVASARFAITFRRRQCVPSAQQHWLLFPSSAKFDRALFTPRSH